MSGQTVHRMSWADFKSQIDSRNLSIQEVKHYVGDTATIQSYELFLYDGDFKATCILYNDAETASEVTDYETNYQPNANKPIKDRDYTGREVVRMAATNKGWVYKAEGLCLITGDLNTPAKKDWQGNIKTTSTIRCYDASDVEITDPATALTNAVKTVLTFKPGYDIEIIAGCVMQHTRPTTNMDTWVIIGVIDNNGIPFDPDGAGTVYEPLVTEFVSGVDLKFIDPASPLETDGRASKILVCDSGVGLPYDENQFQVIVRHDAGVQHDIAVLLEFYRAV